MVGITPPQFVEAEASPAVSTVRSSIGNTIPASAAPNGSANIGVMDALLCFYLALAELDATPDRQGPAAELDTFEPIRVDRAVPHVLPTAVEMAPPPSGRPAMSPRIGILKREAKGDAIAEILVSDRLPIELDTAFETTVANKTPRRSRRG